MVVEIERISPHTNFGGGRCGSFRLAIFTDISVMTVSSLFMTLTRSLFQCKNTIQLTCLCTYNRPPAPFCPVGILAAPFFVSA